MAQRAARFEAPPQASHDRPSNRPFEDLGREWVVLRDCRLRPEDRSSHPTVLIHPARGVAVVDVFPSATPGAVNAIHARLDAARFPAIFSGHLPVVHLRLAPRQTASLPALLDDAFDEEATLRLPGGDAWAGVATRALTSEQLTARPEQPKRPRAAEHVRERRRWLSVLRSAAAVVVCSAALAGVLGSLVNRTPMPTEVPVPAPVVAVVPPPTEVGRTDAGGPSPEAVAPPPESAFVASSPADERSDAEIAPPRPDDSPAPLQERSGADAVPVPALGQPVPQPRRRQDPVQPTERQPAPARKAAERLPRRQQEAEAVAPSPDAGAERCRRVSASIGSDAPLSDADMRFFNEACIRW